MTKDDLEFHESVAEGMRCIGHVLETMPPTNECLQELLAMEAKATPGPWTEDDNSVMARESSWIIATVERGDDDFQHDIALIVASRNALRPLVEALLAERAKTELLSKAIFDCVSDGHQQGCKLSMDKLGRTCGCHVGDLEYALEAIARESKE